jgi:hypothetical protein
MSDDIQRTRRAVLKGTAAVGLAGIGLTSVGGAAADPIARGEFGRVWAKETLYRTNVVHVLDSRPDPEDKIYFLHDGKRPVVATEAGSAQGSPFVSETEPGDRDYNGGQWTHISAEVTDLAAFSATAPITSAAEIMEADFIETQVGRPGFGPPNYFVCPLNGKA